MAERICRFKKQSGGGGSNGSYKTVSLGTGSSFNIKNSYPDLYDKLTVNNFYYRESSANRSKRSSYARGGSNIYAGFSAPSISYNTSTGVLSVGYPQVNGLMTEQTANSEIAAFNITRTVYMIYWDGS